MNMLDPKYQPKSIFSQNYLLQFAMRYPVVFSWTTLCASNSFPQHDNTLLTLDGKKWYFVTKIVLSYCEKKLFY